MTQNHNLIPIGTGRYQTATVRLILHVLPLQKKTCVHLPARLVMIDDDRTSQVWKNP